MLLLASPATKADGQDEPYRFFREFVGLNEDQIGTIRSGKALAKVVEATTPDEVFVFGAVYVKASPESYLELATNIDALRKASGIYRNPRLQLIRPSFQTLTASLSNTKTSRN